MAQQQIDFDPNVDFYKALGVSEQASADEIKKAYRRLAKANHPDSTGGDKAKESRFKDISNAYDVLGDAKKKKLYDQIRTGGYRVGPGGMGGPGGPGGPGGMPGSYTYTSQGSGPGVFDLGDLFSQLFTQQQQQQQQQGRGRRAERGRAPRDVTDVEFESKVKAADGSWLRVEGSDVHSDLRISFDRAILGTVASVATIDGKAEVKVPPGTSSGRRLRLRGKGMPDRAGNAGDHYVTVQIDVPKDVDEEAKKLLVQLAQRVRKREQAG
jgi:DnaJ-class molecular chaperone